MGAAYPETPPASDLSRSRLKEIAHWIRDDLDPLIAREGPDMLRADDVLTLHEIFQGLRTSNSITALDLRATGIHRAILDVAGIATRWPGRLADDCDKIISIWTAKFGRLEDLHPFLYGRGGRLEGIATADEFSKAALLKRWQNTCPEKISPKRSHSHGNLGFTAGDWWINPHFASHAGIIDLDAAEGGICYDKNGAYAILLKDTGELEAAAETLFTYRCGRADQGRFRVTAATPKSRAPIRILRSHSINSIWGPKAGVRYDGLYRVTGWGIRQMKAPDIARTDFRVGDIIYDIKFERDDPVPMEEVIKRPSAGEVDDYSEYKRLRKVHRELSRRGLHAQSHKPDPHVPTKVAPPIPPLAPQPAQARAMSKWSPGASRTATLQRPAGAYRELPNPSPASSGKAMSTIAPAAVAFGEDPFLNPARSTLEVPTQAAARSMTLGPHESDSPLSETHIHPPKLQTSTSNASSGITGGSHLSDVREVAPWIDYDLQLTVPSEESPPPLFRGETIAKVSRESTARISQEKNNQRRGRSTVRNSPSPSGRGYKQREQDSKSPISGKKNTLFLLPKSRSPDLNKKNSRKSMFVRSRNPMAKLFDGAEDGAGDQGDYFSYKAPRSRSASSALQGMSPIRPRHARASSSDGAIRLFSPIPLKPLSQTSPLLLVGRRDAVCIPLMTGNTPFSCPTRSSTSAHSSTDQRMLDTARSRSRLSMPVSLKELISKPKPATAVSSTASTPGSRQRSRIEGDSPDLRAAVSRLKSLMQDMKELDIKIEFIDPFRDQRSSLVASRASSVSVAPDVV